MIQVQDNELEFQKLLAMWIKIEDKYETHECKDGCTICLTYHAFMAKYIFEDGCKHEWYAYTGDEDVSGVCINCGETYRE